MNMQVETTWTALKFKINMPKYFIEYDSRYHIWTISEPVILYTYIQKTDPENDDQIEFESDYKNVLAELSYFELAYPNVLTWDNADDSGSNWAYWDVKIENKSRFLFGGNVLIDNNAIFGDYFTFQIVDVDGIYYPAGSVLSEYIPKRYVKPDLKIDIQMNLGQIKYVYENLYLRLKLTTQQTGTKPKVCAGYYFYEY